MYFEQKQQKQNEELRHWMPQNHGFINTILMTNFVILFKLSMVLIFLFFFLLLTFFLSPLSLLFFLSLFSPPFLLPKDNKKKERPSNMRTPGNLLLLSTTLDQDEQGDIFQGMSESDIHFHFKTGEN